MRGLEGTPCRPQSNITYPITFMTKATLMLCTGYEIPNKYRDEKGKVPEQQKGGFYLFLFLAKKKN